jgi:hypothetical protein
MHQADREEACQDNWISLEIAKGFWEESRKKMFQSVAQQQQAPTDPA